MKENNKILDWEVLMQEEQHVKKVEMEMKMEMENLIILHTQHTKGVEEVEGVVE